MQNIDRGLAQLFLRENRHWQCICCYPAGAFGLCFVTSPWRAFDGNFQKYRHLQGPV